ncbi:MAG: ferrochelatase, partial [Acidobacteria bacterium]
MAGKKRVGVVLFQLGGPDSLEAVGPFLYNLFCDPDIIPLGPLGVVLRRPMAKLISIRRARPVARRYAEIGGRSPIRALTERQRDRLGAALAPLLEATVVIAMRYWHPFASEAVEALHRAGPL